MTAAKKAPLDAHNSYALASAIHRAKVVAKRQHHPDEILPVDGRLHVELAVKPIPQGMETTVFGESSIDIPEFKLERKP